MSEEGLFYYEKNDLWYLGLKESPQDLLIGKSLLPNVFVKKDKNKYLIFIECYGAKTICCKSYQLVTNSSDKQQFVLLGDVSDKRNLFALVKDKELPLLYNNQKIYLTLNAKEYLFLKDKETDFWHTPDNLTPEQLGMTNLI